MCYPYYQGMIALLTWMPSNAFQGLYVLLSSQMGTLFIACITLVLVLNASNSAQEVNAVVTWNQPQGWSFDTNSISRNKKYSKVPNYIRHDTTVCLSLLFSPRETLFKDTSKFNIVIFCRFCWFSARCYETVCSRVQDTVRLQNQ